MKTKQAAMQAARKKLGAAANEGVDFNVRNTGAGWTWEEIEAANVPAAKAKAKRAPKPEHKITTALKQVAAGDVGRTTKVLVKKSPAAAKPKAQKPAAKAAPAPKPRKAPVLKPKPATAPKAAPAAGTKGAAIIDLLKRSGGASSAEMEKATGWKGSSVRGYLGTLRSQGAVIESKKIGKGEPVVYKLHEPKTAPAAAPADVGDVV